MSQDKDVTPMSHSGLRPSGWIERSVSRAPVQLLRRRTIAKMHGVVRRHSRSCGCSVEDSGLHLEQRALVFAALQAIRPSEQILLSTECQLVPTLWFVLTPNGGRYSWCEVFEFADRDFVLSFWQGLDAGVPRTRAAWEALCHTELKLKYIPVAHAMKGTSVAWARSGLIRELMSSQAGYSHINVSVEAGLDIFPNCLNNENPDLAEYEIELLRSRAVPQWRQSGDMAYQSFNTYTVMRKNSEPSTSQA